MSIQFSDTSTKKGLVQLYEKEIGASYGDISGNTNALYGFTADCNIALDDFTELAIKSSGLWQWDDSNQTDYPMIQANLVSGQRDYPFTVDSSGNLILEIYRVMVADSSGNFTEIMPKDQFSRNSNNNQTNQYVDGQGVTGIPNTYSKEANAIFLDPIPSYNRTLGLKVFVNREASYFAYTDTTKKAGIPGIFHKYIYMKPALEYARRKMSNDSYTKVNNEVMRLEENIKTYFSQRERDVPRRLTANVENCK